MKKMPIIKVETSHISAWSRCEDPKCEGYGKKLEDRGYGHPVCSSTPWKIKPEVFPYVWNEKRGGWEYKEDKK